MAYLAAVTFHNEKVIFAQCFSVLPKGSFLSSYSYSSQKWRHEIVKTRRTKYWSSFSGDVEDYPLWGFNILFCCGIFRFLEVKNVNDTCYAPISVKPEWGGGAVGNLTVTYIPRVGILIGHHSPRVGNLIAFLLCATRTEGDFDTFDNYFLPGGGDFDNFFQKMSKSPPYSRTPPPPLGLDTDRCIRKLWLSQLWWSKMVYAHSHVVPWYNVAKADDKSKMYVSTCLNGGCGSAAKQ